MATTVRRGSQTTAYVAIGLLLSPFALFAQDECQFDPSSGASRASSALDKITPESTEADSAAVYAEALESLSGELDGDNAIVFLFAARIHIGLKDFAEAESLLDRFDEVASPECASHGRDQRYNGWVQLYNDGVAAYGLGENESALAIFTLANEFYPDLRSYSNAALLQSEMGDNTRAIETYRAALAADISDPDPDQMRNMIRGLGSLLSAEGQTEEALAAYEGFLAMHPEDVVIRIRYAGVLAEQGQASESQAIYAEILGRTDLSSKQWVEVGVGLYNADNYAEAATAFGKAREANPYNKEAMENYVNASVQAGRPGPVLALADTLVQWYPYDATNYQLLASALAKANMDERAMEIIDQGETTDLVFHFVQMAASSDGTYVVQGSFEAREASGTLSIPFEFLDAGGQVVQTEVLSTDAPPSGEQGSFRLEVQSGVPLAGFRYKKIGA